MLRQMIRSFLLLMVLTGITGLAYPLAVTGIAQALFPYQASGSLLQRDGNTVGSELIGQNFANPGYFHSRPSAAGKDGYDASSSSGSNLGPTNKKLVETTADMIIKVREENGLDKTELVSSDLVLASGSGLDPHISPAAAFLQAERIAQERGLSVEKVKQLVDSCVEDRQFGIFGEQRVNVLKLNLALDVLK